MLADTIVRRWQEHQPLNRLEGIYAWECLELAKSTPLLTEMSVQAV
jgi:transposase